MAVEVRVRYPRQRGKLVLRTSADWERDVEPERVEDNAAIFRLRLREPFVYLKPQLLAPSGDRRWSVGENFLVLADVERSREIFPFFYEDFTCSACALRELADAQGEVHSYRIFYPPGYHENPLASYPVLYMQDGQNLFFAQEAFLGHDWQIRETLALLTGMNAVRPMIVIGVYPGDRMRDYTKPGYEAYGRFLVERLKPAVDAELRTLTAPESTAVMGSSLGGVASFFLAWEHPEVFGQAACLSSTFGYRDDLRRRVESEPRRPVRLYLDSGWPRDNYEVTRDLRQLLLARGYQDGRDLLYFAYPHAAHNEQAWATRCHLPLQWLFGH